VLEKELAAIQLNVDAVVAVSHAVLGWMVRRRSGAIVNLASVVAVPAFRRLCGRQSLHSFVHRSAGRRGQALGCTSFSGLSESGQNRDERLFSKSGALGKLPSLSAEEIVRTALAALEGRDVVKIVGWPNRMLVF
jgi:NAD(P)-dependent dehydrogenase (short-subunit alcohol dehydrogenase family)